MKKILIATFLLLTVVAICFAQGVSKLWVNEEYTNHGDRIYFIQDRETGTRCYAITGVQTSGYAISCVKQ